VKRLVKATGAENYNVLQNNGRIAHQEVDHVSVVIVAPLLQ
jgi:diadenosine tetraphosphate (Ap4A) HIT family hydrolase